MLNLTRKVSVLFLGLVLGILYIHTLPASGHHQGDFFPIDKQYYKLELKAETSGQWFWSYEERCNQGNVRDAVTQAFADTEVRYGVRSTQSTIINQPLVVQNNVSTCGADFTGRCGAGFAVACVGADGARFPVNCDAYYDGPYMATFVSLASKMSVVKHEYTHCRDGRAEGYCDVQESSAPCNTGTICQPSPSIMGCGPNHPLDYSSYDDSAFKVRHYPPKLPFAKWGWNGQWFAFSCNFSINTTRVALLVDEGTGIHWAGITKDLVKDNNGCMGIGPYDLAGFQWNTSAKYYLLPENALSAFHNPVESLVVN